jgi:galactose-1-phosphate uridylyltransferase
MTLCVNPAPPRNLSFIAAPRRQDGHCLSHIGGLKNSDTADVLQRAIAIYRRLMGNVPGYNVILRSGPEIKHLHIEIIPKTGTNVPAGYEDLTEEIIITQDPEETANLLRRRYA